MANRLKKYRMLVITDHTLHKSGDSIYPLLRAMAKNPACSAVEIASRGTPKNQVFFHDRKITPLTTFPIDDNFAYQKNGAQFLQANHQVFLQDFDIVFLRIGRPVSDLFLKFIAECFPQQLIINRPSAIAETGAKDFLINFPEICAPMKICSTIDEILEMYNQFPIVLKPLRSYAGHGMIRILSDTIWDGETKYSLHQSQSCLEAKIQEQGQYLAMKYLKNVSLGDKRIIVVNGKAIGATLRTPKEGSWLCSLAQGGTSSFAEPDATEIKIVETISPILTKKGIVFFGFDTLVDDDGYRVLSEINTLNVGLLSEAELYSGQPVIQKSADLIWSYIAETMA